MVDDIFDYISDFFSLFPDDEFNEYLYLGEDKVDNMLPL